MADADAYADELVVMNPLMEPLVREAVLALRLPVGSCGLDAGCGIGLQALVLAAAVGPSGHVTAVDISADHLRQGAAFAATAGLSGRISLREGDVRSLPFDDGAFDWAWSSCCVGYAPALIPALQELVRVVKAGGIVALFVWSSENLLPGYPQLEARLRATASGIAPYVEGNAPESHCLRALGWLREKGLREPTAHTFVGDAYAPLRKEVREALASLLRQRWPGAEEQLCDADRADFRRLCEPDSPDFIIDQPDYYAFFTCTLFHGRVSG